MPEKVDWFLGSVFAGTAEVTDEMVVTLSEHAEHYLRVCQPIGWAEWQLLSSVSRAAFQRAAERIEDARARRIAELVAERLEAKVQEET